MARNYRKEYDNAYIAGLIDGEGCIRLSKKKGKIQDFYYHPVIEINITNEAVIDYMILMCGGKKYIKHWDNHYKTVYRWVLNKKEDIIELLRDIEPFCIIKAGQVKLLLRALYEQPVCFPLIFERLKEEKKHG